MGKAIQNICQNGDLLEISFCQKYSDRYCDIIKKYNNVWGNFIGNNGKAEPLPLKEQNSINEDDRERLLLGQFCYSLLCNFYYLLNFENNLKKNKDLESFIKDLNFIINIYFNSIEITTKIKNELKVNIKSNSTNFNKSFTEFRNNIIHRVRPFIKLENDEYLIPNFEEGGEWLNDKKIVFYLDDKKFENAEYININQLINILTPKLEDILYNVYEEAFNYLNKIYKKIDLNKMNLLNIQMEASGAFVSGSNFVSHSKVVR